MREVYKMVNQLENQKLYLCDECRGILISVHMGGKCPYCKQWLYTHKCIEIKTEPSEVQER